MQRSAATTDAHTNARQTHPDTDADLHANRYEYDGGNDGGDEYRSI
jgi:hypothetical protein